MSESSGSGKRKKSTRRKQRAAKQQKGKAAATSQGRRTTSNDSMARQNYAAGVALSKNAAGIDGAVTLLQSDTTGTDHQNPKLEPSPNGRAKCRNCAEFISKGSFRVGVRHCTLRSVKYHYYHARCCPPSIANKIPNLEGNVQGLLKSDLHRQPLHREQQQTARNAILAQRRELWREIYRSYGHFLCDEAIDKITVALPANPLELSNALGCEFRLWDHQRANGVLQTVRKHVQPKRRPPPAVVAATAPRDRRRPSRRPIDTPEIIFIDDSDDDEDAGNDNAYETIAAAALPSPAASVPVRNGGGRGKKGVGNVDDDDDDEEIAVEDTLTCAQVIQQKFDRAAANGEIVAID